LEPAFRTNQPAFPSKESVRLCRRDGDGQSLGFRSNRPRTEIGDSVVPPALVIEVWVRALAGFFNQPRREHAFQAAVECAGTKL
jgi:hypothetical protein